MWSELKFETISKHVTNLLKNSTKLDYLAVAIVIFVGLLNFGRILSTYIYNNDGLSRINQPFYTFEEYTQIGRWAYPIFYHLFNSNNYTPFINVLTVIGLLTILIVLIWREFDIKRFGSRVISGAIFISLPILIHYFFYTGDVEVYTSGLLLMVVGFSLFRKSFHKIGAGTIALNVISLGCYPGAFSFLTTLYIGYALMDYHKNEDLKRAFTLFWKGTAISVLSLVLYFIFTKFLLWHFELELTGYRDAASISLTGLILRLPSVISSIYYLSIVHFLTFTPFLRVIQLTLILTFLILLIPKKGTMLVRILTPIIWMTILILSLFSTYFVTYTNGYYIGFFFGILLYFVFLTIVIFENIRGYTKTAVIIIFGIFIFKNIQNNNIITQVHELNNDNAKRIAQNIIQDIQKTPNYIMSKTPVVFIGFIGDNLHYDFISPNKDLIIWNIGPNPVGFNKNQSHKLKNLFYIMYNDVQVYSKGKGWELKQQNRFKSKPNYPIQGSVFLQSDTVFVKLGDLNSAS